MKNEIMQDCFTRACMYLTKGYIDKTEKDDFSVMEWEEFIKKEVADQKDLKLVFFEDEEMIPVKWLKENGASLLDFGEGVEILINKWKSQN